jgi:hypothetical protein
VGVSEGGRWDALLVWRLLYSTASITAAAARRGMTVETGE